MFSSGTVDYLTITAKHGTKEQAACETVYETIKYDEVTHGLDEKPARAMGYMGQKVGTMFVGSSPQGTMFRASGELAQVAAKMFAWMGGNHHVTRIDFQLTWEFAHDWSELAETECTCVRTALKEKKGDAAPTVRLISSFGKGDTLTIGARSSEVFIRLYDKTREMKLNAAPWLWRYEVELKGERALQAMRLFTSRNGDNEVIHQVVDYWCKDRLLGVPWSPTTPLSWPEVGRPESDAERKLKWLETHVKSSVQYLINKGHRSLVYEVLGLDV
jgi:hypothetical protein